MLLYTVFVPSCLQTRRILLFCPSLSPFARCDRREALLVPLLRHVARVLQQNGDLLQEGTLQGDAFLSKGISRGGESEPIQ